MNSLILSKRYSGRTFGPEDIEAIRTLIREHPQASRQRLSYLICETLQWRKPDGGLKDMSCRVAMLRMHREGLIELPAPQHKVNPCRSFARRTAQGEPGPLLEAAVHELDELRLKPVERQASALWNEYIDRYHYLGYKPLPGAQLRYFAYAGERLVGLSDSERRPGRRVRVMSGSAGLASSVGAIWARWSTTPVFSCCPGFASKA